MAEQPGKFPEPVVEPGGLPAKRWQLVLVDDHPVVRTGYRRVLALEPDLEVVADFGDGELAYEALGRLPEVDAVLLDWSMPGRGGLEWLRRLRQRDPHRPVLIVSMHDAPQLVAQALQAGAQGFVSKSSPPEALAQAVRGVRGGGLGLCALAQQALAEAGHMDCPLTEREFALMQHLAQGTPVAELAALFHLSPKTVSNHQTQIHRKLGVEHPVQLHQLALARGWLVARP